MPIIFIALKVNIKHVYNDANMMSSHAIHVMDHGINAGVIVLP
jgi:hypothetical protein